MPKAEETQRDSTRDQDRRIVDHSELADGVRLQVVLVALDALVQNDELTSCPEA